MSYPPPPEKYPTEQILSLSSSNLSRILLIWQVPQKGFRIMNLCGEKKVATELRSWFSIQVPQSRTVTFWTWNQFFL